MLDFTIGSGVRPIPDIAEFAGIRPVLAADTDFRYWITVKCKSGPNIGSQFSAAIVYRTNVCFSCARCCSHDIGPGFPIRDRAYHSRKTTICTKTSLRETSCNETTGDLLIHVFKYSFSVIRIVYKAHIRRRDCTQVNFVSQQQGRAHACRARYRADWRLFRVRATIFLRDTSARRARSSQRRPFVGKTPTRRARKHILVRSCRRFDTSSPSLISGVLDARGNTATLQQRTQSRRLTILSISLYRKVEMITRQSNILHSIAETVLLSTSGNNLYLRDIFRSDCLMSRYINTLPSTHVYLYTRPSHQCRTIMR